MHSIEHFVLEYVFISCLHEAVSTGDVFANENIMSVRSEKLKKVRII